MVSLHTEGVRQCKRHLATRFVGVLGRHAKRLLGVVLVEEVSLEQHPFGTLHGIPGDVARAQHRTRPEVGIHGALAVRGHHDDAASRGKTVVFGCREERHPRIVEVARKHPTEIVVGDLADEAGAPTQTGQSVTGVGNRATAGHHIWGNLRAQERRALVVNQHHGRLREVVLGKEVLVHRRDDVHHGIADGDGVQRGRFHDSTTLDVGLSGRPSSENTKRLI